MNRSTFRKIWGDLWTRKSRTILVSISIFIGVLGVVTLITAGDLLVKQLRMDVREDELPMLSVLMTVVPGAEDVALDDEAYISALREAFPSITEVEGAANNPFYWKLADEERFREGRLNAYTLPLDRKTLEPMRLIEGAYPRSGARELVAEQRLAADFDLAVGDQVDVRMLGVESFPTETWTISGIVFHAYNPTSDLSMYALAEDAPRITGVDGINALVMRFTDFETAQANRDAVQAFINENTPYTAMFALATDPAENAALRATEQFAEVLTVMAVISMLVSGFLVLNVINNLVTEQRRQIGVMKSLGTTRAEMFVIYGGIALAYGLFGMIPAVILGIPLGYQFAVILGDFANTVIGSFSVSETAVGLGVILGLAVPIISAIIPVYAGTRVTILEAMTDLGIGGGYQVGFLNRVVKRLPLPLNVKQSLNNLFQKKGRLALTVVTLTLAVGAFMGVTAVFVQIYSVLQDVLAAYDFEIVFQTTESQAYEPTRNLLLEEVDVVEEVYPGSFGVGQIDGYYFQQFDTSEVMLLGVVPETTVQEDALVEGVVWFDDPDTQWIVLTNEVANQLDKALGDTITITVGANQLEREIVGIVNYPFPMGVLPWEDLARATGYTLGAPAPNEYFTTLNAEGYSGTLPDGQITAWGINAQAAAFLTIVDGASVSGDQPGVLVSQAAAANGEYQVGDEITVQAVECQSASGPPPSDTGAEDSATAACTATLPIVGIFEPPAQLRATQVPQDLLVFFWQDLARLEGYDLNGTPVPNAFYIQTDDSIVEANDADRVIEEINDLLLNRGITASYVNMLEIADMASNAILSIGIVLNLASVIMAAVGAIGLITTLSIAVFERQKEIGVMRSVGARSPAIVMQFLIEGILVGVIAWIIAIPISIGLAWWITDILPFGDFIEFSYPWFMLAVGLVGILVIATISSVWPSVSAARKTVSDILRYQ